MQEEKIHDFSCVFAFIAYTYLHLSDKNTVYRQVGIFQSTMWSRGGPIGPISSGLDDSPRVSLSSVKKIPYYEILVTAVSTLSRHIFRETRGVILCG